MNQDQGNKSATKRQAEHAGKVRLLTASEREELRRDMAEASAWMRAELARRRAMSDLREALARAICTSCDEIPDHSGDCQGNQYRWQDYLPCADAALAVFEAEKAK